MFVAREYASGVNGVQLDGSVVCLVDVYLDDHENKSAQRLFRYNHGYTAWEIVSVVTKTNITLTDNRV